MKHLTGSTPLSLALALAVGVTLSLSGCAPEPAGNGGDTGTSQTEPDAATDNAEKPADGPNEYGFIDEDGAVPDWVAEGFPLYPGSVNYAVTEAAGSQILGFTVPNVDEATIYQWLVDQYSQNGWESYDHNDETSDFGATHADGRETYINVTQSSYVMTAKQG